MTRDTEVPAYLSISAIHLAVVSRMGGGEEKGNRRAVHFSAICHKLVLQREAKIQSTTTPSVQCAGRTMLDPAPVALFLPWTSFSLRSR